MTATGYVGRERVCPHGEFFAREFANGTISCVVAADVNCPNGILFYLPIACLLLRRPGTLKIRQLCQHCGCFLC